MEPAAISHFCAYLHTAELFAPHHRELWPGSAPVFCAARQGPRAVSWRDIEAFIQQQRQAQLAATTINRRLNALKHFFEYLVMERQTLAINPVKPSHFLRRGRPLPKPLSQDQVRTLFAQITHPMDHALGLLMLRCGLRVSEVARLRLDDIDWAQQSLRIDQGKGRKDRLVYLSADALAALRTCLAARPAVGARRVGVLESEAPASGALHERHPEKDGALCQGGGHQGQLSQSAPYLCLQPVGSRGRGDLHQGTAGTCVHRVQRTLRETSNQRVKQVYRQTIRKVIAKTRV